MYKTKVKTKSYFKFSILEIEDKWQETIGRNLNYLPVNIEINVFKLDVILV